MPFCAFAGSSTFTGIEIAGDDRLCVFVGGVDDPQHEKERHHRRHEIGESDLPGAAVVLFLVAAAAPDDDDFGMRASSIEARYRVERGDEVGPRLQLAAIRRIVGLDRDLDAMFGDVFDFAGEIGDAFAQRAQNALRAANLDQAGRPAGAKSARLSCTAPRLSRSAVARDERLENPATTSATRCLRSPASPARIAASSCAYSLSWKSSCATIARSRSPAISRSIFSASSARAAMAPSRRPRS